MGLKLDNCYSGKYGLSAHACKEGDGGYYLTEKILKYQECCKRIRKSCFNKSCILTDKGIILFKDIDCCHICGKKYKNTTVFLKDQYHLNIND